MGKHYIGGLPLVSLRCQWGPTDNDLQRTDGLAVIEERKCYVTYQSIGDIAGLND